jgi:hypothetical protein
VIPEAIRPLLTAPTVDVPTAGRVFGLNRSAAYDAIARGDWPTPHIRIGRKIVVPTAPVLELLGLAHDRSTPGPAPPGPGDATTGTSATRSEQERFDEHHDTR